MTNAPSHLLDNAYHLFSLLTYKKVLTVNKKKKHAVLDMLHVEVPGGFEPP